MAVFFRDIISGTIINFQIKGANFALRNLNPYKSNYRHVTRKWDWNMRLTISRHHKNLLKIYPSKSYLELRVMTSYYPVFCQLEQFHPVTEHLSSRIMNDVSRIFFFIRTFPCIQRPLFSISRSEQTLYLKLEKVELWL